MKEAKNKLKFLFSGMWALFGSGSVLLALSGFGIIAEEWSYVGAALNLLSVLAYLLFLHVLRSVCICENCIKGLLPCDQTSVK